ncbi:MAG: HypC/HybG/HupF family hydrogenase formation chaperone [Inquilinus sp.]|nr:HypC/HybG/HupF family hydrogenase formation chaperone [Inquilinus sp.]
MPLVRSADVLAIDRKSGTAIVELDGGKAEVSILLLDKVGSGDQVLVHLGFALSRVDPAGATATLELIASEAALDGADKVLAA